VFSPDAGTLRFRSSCPFLPFFVFYDSPTCVLCSINLRGHRFADDIYIIVAFLPSPFGLAYSSSLLPPVLSSLFRSLSVNFEHLSDTNLHRVLPLFFTLISTNVFFTFPIFASFFCAFETNFLSLRYHISFDPASHALPLSRFLILILFLSDIGFMFMNLRPAPFPHRQFHLPP